MIGYRRWALQIQVTKLIGLRPRSSAFGLLLEHTNRSRVS